MSLATYSDLTTAVQNWMARSDFGVGFMPSLADLVTLFEANANTRLANRRQELTATLTPTAGVVALPTDYLSWRNVVWNGSSPAVLDYVHPTYFSGRWVNGAQGTPVAFTIIGSNLYVGPLDNTSLTFDYFGTISALSAGANWLFTNYPNAYLFGTLAEGFAAIQDLEKAQIWASRRDAVYADILLLDARTRGPSRIQIDGPVV